MTKKKKEYIVVIAVLGLIFVGLYALINSTNYKRLVAVQDGLAASGESAVTLTLNANTCHYFVPSGAVDAAVGHVFCPACGDIVAGIKVKYDLQMIDTDFCGRRSETRVLFTKKVDH